MAYLDNSTVTVDAILTKQGRKLLAQDQPLNISYFTLSQFGSVFLEIENVRDAKLIEYTKNKVKIQFKLLGDIRVYRMKFKKKEIPIEYRANVKLIGYVYFYLYTARYYLENVFILNNDYDNCFDQLPSYESVINTSI